MFKFIIVALFTIASLANSRVLMTTNLGDIELELFDKKAPKTVKNFLEYVESGFYNDTIFHRVIDNFMIQGGGFTSNLQKKKTRAPIENEANNRISNTNGTVAMARTQDINSATAQFFINVKDNYFLDHKGAQSFGYAVFGRVVKGMSIVNRIKKSRISKNGRFENLPTKNIIIKSSRILK